MPGSGAVAGEMGSELLEIRPRELKFAFELKRQSSCSIQLINNSNHYVAFKVKTTSPRNYCVRPNVGIVLPKTTCDLTVTMQAQKITPPDLQCNDKFLVQSTVVPFGTMEGDLNPNLFSKENGRFIEENKLRVALVSPPHLLILQPVKGALDQEPASEFPVLKETPILEDSPGVKAAPVSKESPLLKETHIPRDQVPSDMNNLHSSHVAKERDKNLRAKLIHLESKLSEADRSIIRLLNEKTLAIQETHKLQQEVVLLKGKCAAGIRVGFPLLFVCFVALLGVALGYLMH
uniref:Vesicle-associated protein 2-2 n=2 Tax=Anthurium amnicola TaxID=1678845 RepID=A0A1D1Z3A3_9ARAE